MVDSEREIKTETSSGQFDLPSTGARRLSGSWRAEWSQERYEQELTESGEMGSGGVDSTRNGMLIDCADSDEDEDHSYYQSSISIVHKDKVNF